MQLVDNLVKQDESGGQQYLVSNEEYAKLQNMKGLRRMDTKKQADRFVAWERQRTMKLEEKRIEQLREEEVKEQELDFRPQTNYNGKKRTAKQYLQDVEANEIRRKMKLAQLEAQIYEEEVPAKPALHSQKTIRGGKPAHERLYQRAQIQQHNKIMK